MGKRLRAWKKWKGQLRQRLGAAEGDGDAGGEEVRRMAVTLCRRTGQVGVNELLDGETLSEFARRFDEERLCPCGGCGRPVSEEEDARPQGAAAALAELMAAARAGESGGCGPADECAICDYLDEMERTETLAGRGPVRFRWGQPPSGGGKPN